MLQLSYLHTSGPLASCTALHNLECKPQSVSETVVEKKERCACEKKARKQNKKLGHSEMLVACSQNFNGSSSREKIEEAARIMSFKKSGLCSARKEGDLSIPWGDLTRATFS
jgi:hypothetical protein